MKLRNLARPFLCAVIAEPTPRSCINQIDRLERFADSFEVNLPPLSVGALKDVFAATRKPCIATNRRPNFMKLYGYRNLRPTSETERVSKLVKALDAGASVIDFELDTYDDASIARKPSFGSRQEQMYAMRPRARPTEFSKAPGIVRMQRKLCETVRSVGGEVLISSHPQIRVNTRRVLSIGRAIRERGANYAKIVVFTFGAADVLTLFQAVDKLRSIRVPFNLMNVGVYPLLGRLAATAFGSSWIYCRADSPNSFPGQPSLMQAAKFLGRT